MIEICGCDMCTGYTSSGCLEEKCEQCLDFILDCRCERCFYCLSLIEECNCLRLEFFSSDEDE